VRRGTFRGKVGGYGVETWSSAKGAALRGLGTVRRGGKDLKLLEKRHHRKGREGNPGDVKLGKTMPGR